MYIYIYIYIYIKYICVKTFIRAINHDIKSSKTKKHPRDTLRNLNVKHFLIYKKEKMTQLSQKLTKEALW